MNRLKVVLKKYQVLVKTYPVSSQAIQSGLLMGVGDTIAQVCIEKKGLEEFNVKRLFNYSLVGFVYVGPSLRIWYGGLDKMFPSSGRKLQFKKVLVDQCIFAPAFIASILTLLMGINGVKPDAIKEKLKQDYKDILITNYKIWPAVMIVNFSFVPVNYQVLVTQTVAVLWNIYFAWKANQPVVKIEGSSVTL